MTGVTGQGAGGEAGEQALEAAAEAIDAVPERDGEGASFGSRKWRAMTAPSKVMSRPNRREKSRA